MDPLLKWAGGKRKLVKDIESSFGGPCLRTYHEPFLGSGAVYLARAAAGKVTPSGSILSDVNRRLICFHRAIRDRCDDVLTALSGIPVEGVDEALYLRVRREFQEEAEGSPAQAAMLLWLNKAGFNGLYRENRSGGYNIPWGKRAQISLPSEDHVRGVSKLLEGARLHIRDFREALGGAFHPGDQIYVDPPYVPKAKDGFVAYSSAGFRAPDHQALSAACVRAGRQGAAVRVSQHDLPETFALYSGLVLERRFDVQRSVSCGARGKVGEVILAG